MTIIHENIFAEPFTAEEAKHAFEEWDRETKRCLEDFGKLENPTKEQFAMLDLLQEEAAYTKMALMKYIDAIRQ